MTDSGHYVLLDRLPAPLRDAAVQDGMIRTDGDLPARIDASIGAFWWLLDQYQAMHQRVEELERGETSQITQTHSPEALVDDTIRQAVAELLRRADINIQARELAAAGEIEIGRAPR